MTYRPPGYDLVSDDDRALYDAVTARMATAVEQQRHDRHAAWRVMGDRNGWCHIDGRPDDLLAVKRVTKTQIVTEAVSDGMSSRLVYPFARPSPSSPRVSSPGLCRERLPRGRSPRSGRCLIVMTRTPPRSTRGG